MRLHVPLERNTAFSSFAGTAKNAEAVSCEAASRTVKSKPTFSFTRSVSPPSASPGLCSSPKIFSGKPTRAMISLSHVLCSAETIAVVLAFVYSFTATPESLYVR